MKRTFTFCLACCLALITFFAPEFAKGQSTINFDIETTSDDPYIIKAIALPGSRLAVLACNAYAVNVYLWIYDASGTRTASYDITNRFNWPHNTHDMVEMNAVATNTGKIFISYGAVSNSMGIQTYNARYILLNDNGTLQTSGQLNTTDAGSNYTWKITVDKLSDGKIVAVWKQENNGTLVYRLFNADGSAFTSDRPFAGPGTSNSNASNLYNMYAVAGKNGNFMISLYYSNGYMRGFSFDNAGNNAVSGGQSSFAVDPTVSNDCYNLGLVALANGNYAACWWLDGSFYTKVFSASGSTVVNKQAVSCEYFTNMLPVHTPGSEGFMITQEIPQDPSDDNNPHKILSLDKYNQSGVLQNSASGSEGALIEPTYQYISNSSSGFAYVYSYYKSYSTDPMDGYSIDGDRDTKGSLNQFGMSTLPVTLISYRAIVLSNQKVQLTWKTASETNNSHFEIEKSSDGRTFTFIGQVKAKESTGYILDYSFTDESPITGIMYYRLKQVDVDGTQKNMGIKTVHAGQTPNALRAYPNPISGNRITVSTGNEPLPAMYRITDVQGKLVQSGTLQHEEQLIDVPGLKKGVYFLYIGAGQVIKISK